MIDMTIDIPLVETAVVPDVYVTGIARIEKLAHGIMRFVLYTEQDGMMGRERAIVARLIWPEAALPSAIRQTAGAIAGNGMLCCAKMAVRH